VVVTKALTINKAQHNLITIYDTKVYKQICKSTIAQHTL